MKPYYWESDHGNFGDDLNLWLWDFLLPGFRDVHQETLLVGVGTVLNKVLLPEGQHKLVIGSGFGYGSLPDMSRREEWDIRAVRGPQTAQKLGLDPSFGIIDPAVMVTEMPEFQSITKRYRKSFIPHWESAISGIWSFVAANVGLNYIDPCGEAKSVIRKIAESELIIAESMHGAILADAFRVPWVAVTTSKNINSFKWNDWAQTVGVRYQPTRIAVSTRGEARMKNERFWGVGFDSAVESAPQTPAPAPAPTPMPHSHAETGDLALAERPKVQNLKDPASIGLKEVAKRALAMPAMMHLWQASRAEPQLSSDARLQERKERFQAVLDGVKRDYL